MSIHYMMTVSGESIDLGPLPFNLHVRDSAGRLILYARKGVNISEELKESINRKGRVFFISLEEVDDYLDYTLDNVETIVKSKSISAKRKSGILRDVGEKIFTKITRERLDARSVGHSQQFTRSVVDLILGSPDAYVSLLSLANNKTYLFDHAVNSCTFAIMIGQDIYGQDEVKLYLLGMGALLMDIGMNYVDAQILKKDKKLSDNELQRVRHHARHGFELLKEYDLPEEVLNMVLYHHERMDGSGYPEGLSGSSIPEEARIAAVIDVYDAMTTDRSYRSEKKHIHAINEMLAIKGQFDESILRALMRVVLKNEALIEKLMIKHSVRITT